MPNRFDIALGRAKQIMISQERKEEEARKRDAVLRARVLSKMDPLPELAMDYIMTFIWSEDMSNRKFLVGLSHYAQAVEGCNTDDPEFMLTQAASDWFYDHRESR